MLNTGLDERFELLLDLFVEGLAAQVHRSGPYPFERMADAAHERKG
ncbi:MAG: hypothetical protein M3433_04755 [Actinomycetota bacterium]|nr:hypothetical protein [Actinomycetota bacterium]MDQ3647879.1 hypothetical protein [Actinomycetota bacterium]